MYMYLATCTTCYRLKYQVVLNSASVVTVICGFGFVYACILGYDVMLYHSSSASQTGFMY